MSLPPLDPALWNSTFDFLWRGDPDFLLKRGRFKKGRLDTARYWNQFVDAYFPPWLSWLVCMFTLIVLILAIWEVVDLYCGHKGCARIATLSERVPSSEPDCLPCVMERERRRQTNKRMLMKTAEPKPRQLVNVYTAGCIVSGTTKLHLKPSSCCRSQVETMLNICHVDELLGVGNKHWCYKCICVQSITDDRDFAKSTLECHDVKADVLRQSVCRPHPLLNYVSDEQPQCIRLCASVDLAHIEDWSASEQEHTRLACEKSSGREMATPKHHLDPELCAGSAGHNVLKFRCRLDIAIGFGLDLWCPRCTKVSNRREWKRSFLVVNDLIPNADHIVKWYGSVRSPHVIVDLQHEGMQTEAEGHGEKVYQDDTSSASASHDRCALLVQ